MTTLSHELERCGRMADVLSICSEATRAAFVAPTSKLWHDGSLIVEACQAFHRLEGDEALDALFFHHIGGSAAVYILPLVRTLHDGAALDPSIGFTSLGAGMSLVMRGVTPRWSPTGPTTGRLGIEYQEDLPALVSHAWRGSLRAFLSVYTATGTIEPLERTDARSFVFAIAW